MSKTTMRLRPDMTIARPGWVVPEARDVTAKGHRIRYWEQGTGPVIVLIHGFGGSAEFEWGRVMTLLARNFRVIAPQVIGFAPADVPDMVYSTEALTDHLGAFCAALGLSDFVLVGESFGGWLVGSYAARLGEGAALPAIAKLVVVGGALGKIDMPEPTARGFVQPAVQAEADVQMAKMPPGTIHDATRMAIIRDSGLGKGELDAAMMAKIAVPTLLIWGDQDELIPLAKGEAALAAIPDARLVVLEDIGHIPSVECPAEFVRVVEEFCGV